MSVIRVESFDGRDVRTDPLLERSDRVFGPDHPPIHPTDEVVRSLPDDCQALKNHIVVVSRWCGQAWNYISEHHQDVHERDATIARLSRRLADADKQIAALSKAETP